ncbi:MAG: hypothetical protein IM571_02665 [Chitinophagaceae bacterium]|jgi:hypothetical protein|nr:hypothetical protein [Chitinophagaceae bacterium]MCA6469208.1 hypothetical protein [Chitinophagaceae bacterium]MCA6476834.1 hypothetical protein [Chitinophagaceae bacterium]MCA6481078.1 hypothetical protein [Chitinophagaceae bacterium]MCA6486062.1 hypothetical protein [Chitinophagaceae bacterium]
MINHENFDMYCMRCADGELSPAELEAFHAYLASHPELKGEWEIWQQLKMPVDSSLMPDKEQLFKKEQVLLEEERAWMLIDGELASHEKLATEQLIASNEEAGQLVNHLRQFVLEPTAIECPNKHLLLRSAEQPRVIWMQRVVRFTAAAAIVALLLQVAITKRTGTSLPASTTESTTFSKPATTPASSLPVNAPVVDDAINSTVSTEKNKERIKKPLISPTVIENSTNNTPTSVVAQEILTAIASNPPVTKDPIVEKINAPEEKTGIVAATLSDDDSHTTKPLAQQVIYRELDTESERTTITIGSVEMREGKVRGVWRKLGAIIKSPAQRNNTSDNSSITTQQPL